MNPEELAAYEAQVFQLSDPFDDELTEPLADEYGCVQGCYIVRPAPTYG